MVAGCNSSNMTANSLAWRYGYDKAGHQTLATPPDNTIATDLAATTATYDMAGAGRLTQTVSGPRTTSYSYDDLGRTTQVGVTTGSATLTTTSTLDGVGRTIQIATSGTSSDTITQTYDALDRLTGYLEAASRSRAFTYNADGTAASRTDYDPTGGSHSSSFTYTTLGQLASASLPDNVGPTDLHLGPRRQPRRPDLGQPRGRHVRIRCRQAPDRPDPQVRRHDRRSVRP